VAGVERLVDQLHDVIRTLRSMSVPLVAALNGPAVGAGISLAMAADVRVVAPSASFVPGYLAVGATPDGGASYHLARAFGGPQALSTFLLNRRIDAEELLASGLAQVVPPGEDLVDHSVAVAGQLAGLSPEALGGIRSLVDGGGGHGLDAHLDAEKRWFLRVSTTPQFRSSMSAFSGKPSPAARRRPA
jgi:2-(1,2-epoxy-1,2-dihydrophenyl)acetyl-CoA isomerase